MLPRKAIIAIVVGSLLLVVLKGLNEEQTENPPNLLLGFALVGAVNAFKTLKELTQPL